MFIKTKNRKEQVKNSNRTEQNRRLKQNNKRIETEQNRTQIASPFAGPGHVTYTPLNLRPGIL